VRVVLRLRDLMRAALGPRDVLRVLLIVLLRVRLGVVLRLRDVLRVISRLRCVLRAALSVALRDIISSGARHILSSVKTAGVGVI